MLNGQTFEKLNALKLSGMAEALKEQLGHAGMSDLSFEERIAMLVDAEHLYRENRRMKRLLKNAKLKLAASLEDIDYRSPRGLDRSVIRGLGTCGWIRKHQNGVIVNSCVRDYSRRILCRHGYATRSSSLMLSPSMKVSPSSTRGMSL